MTNQHPDLAAEQAYVDHAYECLERTKADAWKIRGLTEAGVGVGGTYQSRFERDVFDEAILGRLSQLDLGDAALVFGRIDRLADEPTGSDASTSETTPSDVEDSSVESFHIGRLAVADEHRDPVVIDWRAPVAEPFYRATGREPMGLARRRHFAVKGRQLLGIEDELFGHGHLGIGHDDGLDGVESAPHGGAGVAGISGLRGYSTLLQTLERGRTGQLGDIVATIQGEQDEIIRSPQAGVLVVQGGPGTGKTVVALHRAAYLLYTHRFPLEDQGVLVIGPNRVFLRYIERVLPSLGEAGVEQVVLNDLVPDVQFGGKESQLAARVKGDVRISDVIAKAARDRERALREDLVLPFGRTYVRLTVDDSIRLVKAARRRYRRHNGARKWFEGEVFATLAASSREQADPRRVREAVRHHDDFRAAMERMWPVLTPAELLHDLFGSKALLKLAAERYLSEDEWSALHRPRSADVTEVRWTDADAALLDEARELLGPRPRRNGKADPLDEIRTYGHIVIDEVQDLTPMQLRMASRRSLNGSMTVVGDLAQATGALAPSSWDDVTEHLPDRKGSRVVGLSIGYRIPGEIMALATRVMLAATPDLRPPTSVREGGTPPTFVQPAPSRLGDAVIASVRELLDDVGDGNVAVVAPDARVDELAAALAQAGIAHSRATRTGLEGAVSLVPVSVVKGSNSTVSSWSNRSRSSSPSRRLRSLYVALTRSTQRLTIVHARVPDSMRPDEGGSNDRSTSTRDSIDGPGEQGRLFA
ncbi:MAG: AAA family ATPase [Ilumatobacteraceae bacterium]